MNRVVCLGLLLALLTPALAADPAADLAAGRWEAYLGAVGAGPVDALGVAVALDGLPAGEREAWRRRLPPVGPALDGYLRLLRGEAAGLLELLRVLPGP